MKERRPKFSQICRRYFNEKKYDPCAFVSDIEVAFPEIAGLSIDRNEFLWLIRKSLSLDVFEKMHVLESLPNLSKLQIEGVAEILRDELVTFHELLTNEEAALEVLIVEAEKNWTKVKKKWRQRSDRDSLPRDHQGFIAPSGIKQLLDAHVIGQGEAVKHVSLALYYQQVAIGLARKRKPVSFSPLGPLLLVGETGCGKTFVVQKGCELLDLPFVHIDTASMVQEGIVGFSINDLGKLLLEAANDDIQLAERSIVLFDEFDKLLSTQHGSAVVHQLLKILEGGDIRITAGRWDSTQDCPATKSLNTGNMLFILCGAFQGQYDASKRQGIGFAADRYTGRRKELSLNDLTSQGFPKELVGRITRMINLAPLGKGELYQILKKGKSSPLHAFSKRMECVGTALEASDTELRAIAENAVMSGVGARGLNQLLYDRYFDLMYNQAR